MFVDDIDALVKETISHSEGLNRNPFMDFSFNTDECGPGQVPGVFYHLEKKVSTFVIRIFESQNLSADYQDILDHPENYPSLRLIDEEDHHVADRLKYFECDLFELARNIKSELANKRFPIFEEHIFNVSDPGDSWWVKLDDNQIKIFFKLSRTESMDKLIKLGPLGDAKVAMEKFNRLYGYFKMLFPIEDYSSAHGQFTIKSDDQNKMFYAFKKIFSKGDSGFEFWDSLRKLEMKSQNEPFIESLKQANLFMMDLANIRRFWIQIQNQID